MKLDNYVDPCTHCGVCMSLCAWDAAERAGRAAGPELCRDCQICYRICPRLPYDRAALAETLFPTGESASWGRYLDAHTVRCTERPAGVQDGGFVTSLTAYMLQSGIVDAVLVTGRDEGWRPRTYWATDSDDLLPAVGSKYSTGPAMALLGEGLERYARVAVVALPCQAAALARLRQMRSEWQAKIHIIVGLFCTESFHHGDAEGGLVQLVEERLGAPISQVAHFDITRGRFTARAGEQSAEWKMKEMHDVVWPICLACTDLAAEFADLSVGSIGSGGEANTVIVRTPGAAEIVAAGAEAGLWNLAPMENADLLEKLCQRKCGNPERLSDEERRRYGRESVRGTWKRRLQRTAS